MPKKIKNRQHSKPKKTERIDKKQLEAQLEGNRWARRSFWIALIGVVMSALVVLIPMTNSYLEVVINKFRQIVKLKEHDSSDPLAFSQLDIKFISVGDTTKVEYSATIKENQYLQFSETLENQSSCESKNEHPTKFDSDSVKVSWYCADAFVKWARESDSRIGLSTRKQLSDLVSVDSEIAPLTTETEWTKDCFSSGVTPNKCLEFYVHGGHAGMKASPGLKDSNTFRLVREGKAR